MNLDLLHIVLATAMILLWLGIVIGWLMTCRQGGTSEAQREEETHPGGNLPKEDVLLLQRISQRP
jgi:hypothetical protein